MAETELRKFNVSYLTPTDTTENWERVNPILPANLECYDSTVQKMKIGDGVSYWKELPYLDDIKGCDMEVAEDREVDSMLDEVFEDTSSSEDEELHIATDEEVNSMLDDVFFN